MVNVTEIQTVGADLNKENPKLIYERLIQTTVSEALIADAIEMYAETFIQDDAERDEFAEKYGHENYEPIIKKSVLDVVVAIVAAHTVATDEAFTAIIHMLEIEEDDDVIRNMKLVMLNKMTEDAVGDMDETVEQVFKRRIKIAEANIG